ncbi:hypothetical protein K9L97_01705 [Candidatus Woesearchaeota archaeon]|nr:hypothetical protein [Candidatus Woesearchaeota archaeon]
MGLSNKKEEQLKQMPVIKTTITKSKTGKYLIHRTEIVTIRPLAYYEAVLANKEEVRSEADEELEKFVEEN